MNFLGFCCLQPLVKNSVNLDFFKGTFFSMGLFSSKQLINKGENITSKPSFPFLLSFLLSGLEMYDFVCMSVYQFGNVL